MTKVEAPIAKKMRFYDSLNFWKNKKICMEKVVGEQDHFPYKSSKLSENSNCRINLVFHSRDLKFDYCGIFDALFPFLAFFK